MQFNVGKCKVVHCGKNSVCGQLLEEVKTEKDLGIVFSSNMKVETM